MKKLTITIALILVVALAMPAFGQSFSDVPSDHWAYDAINKLVAAGIVEGYPDGEYKGSQNMTRYEMAVMVSRALDNIVAEQEALANQVDEMGEGLTTGQAEDVTAIVKSLMEKNTQDSLSDAQAEEVADIVDALTFELQAELKVLGADIDALGKDVDELAAKVDAMDVPEDNIEFGMDVTTSFEVANYEDETNEKLVASMLLWADGDALDLDMPVANNAYDANDLANTADGYIDRLTANNFPQTGEDWEDGDALPSEKRFWQEYDFNINGNLGEAKFNLDVDTFTNMFSEEDSAFGYQELDSKDFVMDSALLTVEYYGATMKAGDHADYGVARYFNDEEDLRGLEVAKNYYDIDWTFLAAGEDTDDGSETDVYGVTAAKDMDFGTVTGNLYQARLGGDQISTVGIGIEDVVLTDVVTVGGEVAFNDNTAQDESDIYAMVNGEFAATEELTLDAKAETVGENFYGYNPDFEEDRDYNLFNIGAEYVLNENNTITGAYTFVQPGDSAYYAVNADEDKSTVDLGLENVYGDFTNNASVSYTMNDNYLEDYTTMVIELGTEYAWNETTTLGVALVNKNEEDENGDNVINYNYLKGTLDKELADNMTWNTEAKYIMGDVGINEVEGEGSALTTSLSVSF
ncbi:S-layer family protein [Halanaerobium saccharolyticum]|uniref:S-layer family protein n=1 Tax=Halanaerobium saccharolyticum TaxID=43595 RepID=A0A4R7Z790_9FIRM|nr:S-layer homology domain-containing protein [Halanaerobium saccharolyticum]RAK09787.1 S-layer family protein [Halanaerobium saccharolyticum]TDW07349.1 S-layer family protein [Halanaerobium saccharolyticum]TDX61228.1 S-layer family protein [Halanaerobium saccharolyticum]